MNDLNKNRDKRLDEREEEENKEQISLDKYSFKLIKIGGVIGIIMGFIIVGVFWFWIFKKLF